MSLKVVPGTWLDAIRKQLLWGHTPVNIERSRRADRQTNSGKANGISVTPCDGARLHDKRQRTLATTAIEGADRIKPDDPAGESAAGRANGRDQVHERR